MLKISEKPEDKKTSGTNRLSKNSSSEYDDLWIDPGQVLRLFVRETYISSFPFLEKWIWPSTNHWERVLFMLCQKLQHASFSLLVVLTLFVIMLCFVWRKPQCVLFVMGARGWGRCVFNYHLVEWLMVRQSSTELQLSVCVCVCVCVCSSMCDYVCMCVSLPVQTAPCMCVCACRHLSFYVICALIFPIFQFHSALLHPSSVLPAAKTRSKKKGRCLKLSLLSIKFSNNPQGFVQIICSSFFWAKNKIWRRKRNQNQNKSVVIKHYWWSNTETLSLENLNWTETWFYSLLW